MKRERYEIPHYAIFSILVISSSLGRNIFLSTQFRSTLVLKRKFHRRIFLCYCSVCTDSYICFQFTLPIFTSSVFFPPSLYVISPAFITVVNARERLPVCPCLHLLCFKYVTTSWNLIKLTTRNYVLDTSYLLATLIIK